MREVNLSRPLDLEERVMVPDSAGGLSETWAVRGTLWADLRPRTAGSTEGEAASLSRSLWTITVRASPYGSPSRPVAGNRFRDGRRPFSILAVQEADPSARWLLCMAEEERAI